MSKSTSKNIKLGVLISYITLAVSIVGNILVTRKVLNYVGDYNYGLFSFVNSVTTWLTIISNALGASFVRFATIENNENGNERQVKTLYNRMFLIIAAVTMAVASGLLLILYFNNVQLFGYDKTDSDILYVLFGSSIIQVGITIGFSVYTLFINYKKKFIFARSLALLTNLALYAGNWIIAYTTRNIIYIGIYAAVSASFSILVQIFYVKFVLKESGFHGTKIVDKTLFKRILLFSGILIFGAVVSQISNQVDKTILGSMGLPSDVTIYQLGQSFSTYVIVLSSSVAAVYIPTINELVVQNKNDDLNRLFLRVSKFQIIIVVLVVFGFLSAGKDFTVLWVGEERIKVYYIGTAWLLLLLCSETMNLSIEIQRARNKHLFRCITFFALSVGNIGLSILLIHLMGRDKAVEACLLGSVIISFLSNWVALNIYNSAKMKLPVFRYFLTLFAHCIFGGAAFLASYFLFKIPALKNLEYTIYSLLIKGFVFVFVYLVFIIIFDWRFVKSIVFERSKMKNRNEESSGEDEKLERISIEDASDKMSFVINTRSIYYFKYLPEDLFVEIGYINDLGHEKTRKLLRAFVRFLPNNVITRFLCNRFVPKIYPKNIIDLINSSKRNICFFDSAITPDLLQFVLTKNKNVLIYSWNQFNPDYFRRYYSYLIPTTSIFTYSRIEAKLYDIEYVPEPLMKIENIVEKPADAKYKHDFYFLGKLKDKEEVIVKTCGQLVDNGFSVRIDVIDAREELKEKYPFINIIDKMLTYEEYLANLSISKCLLELVSNNNPNVTWRPFESFLYERKLLSNSGNCMDEPYLSSDNVLIIDPDNFDASKVKEFMNKPYDYTNHDINKWTHAIDDFINFMYKKFLGR